MSNTPDPELLLRKVKAKGVLKVQLAGLAQKAGLWDGKAKITITELHKRLLAPENLNSVWPHHHLLPEPKPDVEQLKTLREALDNSTRVNRTLGLSFVALMFYILLIITSTTDLMLFLPESTVHLPIIDVDLPLIGFYTTVPFIILVIHFNLLVNLKHHQQKYRLWRDAVGAKGDSNLLDPILINFLDAYSRSSPLRLLLILMISTSIFYFPLINLILLLFRFGDYHSFSISSWQFIVTLADVGLVWGFFYLVFYRKVPLRRYWMRILSFGHWPTHLLFLLAVLVWSLTLCLNGRLDDPRYMSWFLPDNDLPRITLNFQVDKVGTPSEGAFLHFLNDNSNMASAFRRASLFFGKRLDLRERDLRYANLGAVNLVGANLMYCNLASANLSGARFDGAMLYRSKLERAELTGASFHGAVLTAANLINANCPDAQLVGAILDGANLSGAILERAHLEGADLAFSDMIATNLNHAVLIGSNLEFANTTGATFVGASLQGASLKYISLAGADFSSAKMRGVSLNRYDLSDSAFFTSIDWVSMFSFDSVLEMGSDLDNIDFRNQWKGPQSLSYTSVIESSWKRMLRDSTVSPNPAGITRADQCKTLSDVACSKSEIAAKVLKRYCLIDGNSSDSSSYLLRCLPKRMCASCPDTLNVARKLGPFDFLPVCY